MSDDHAYAAEDLQPRRPDRRGKRRDQRNPTVRVWGIPCPTLGGDPCAPDYDITDRRYRAWFWLYRNNQRARHTLGIHQRPWVYSIAPRCEWCGHRSAKQRAVAAANRNPR